LFSDKERLAKNKNPEHGQHQKNSTRGQTVLTIPI